jgi:hypothetical protein
MGESRELKEFLSLEGGFDVDVDVDLCQRLDWLEASEYV